MPFRLPSPSWIYLQRTLKQDTPKRTHLRSPIRPARAARLLFFPLNQIISGRILLLSLLIVFCFAEHIVNPVQRFIN